MKWILISYSSSASILIQITFPSTKSGEIGVKKR